MKAWRKSHSSQIERDVRKPLALNQEDVSEDVRSDTSPNANALASKVSYEADEE